MHDKSHTTRNSRFNADFAATSFEKITRDEDINMIPWLSDKGLGAASVRLAAEPDWARDIPDPHRDKIAAAVWHLRRIGKARLVPVLLLIFRYGSRRRYAIKDLAQNYGLSYAAAEKRYFRYRKELMEEFVRNLC